MSRKIYVLNQRQEETFDAAGKAMRDVFSVLGYKGAKTIWSVPKSSKRWLKLLDLPYLILFLACCVGKNDFVFYSIPENHIKIILLKKLQWIRKYKIVCFINDLNAFRYEYVKIELLDENAKQELIALGAADYVLVPNQNTKRMLQEAGITAKLIPVGVWDYLMEQQQIKAMQQKRVEAEQTITDDEKKISIAFAGNLNKSVFLSVMDVPDMIKLELWGKLDEDKKKDMPVNSSYHGVLSSEEVPIAICTMDYGLVWDGVGADVIEGGLGEYLRYNNSHKCALYLAAGIPVIVWSQSGMAQFVREHECGITIDRLSNLERQLKAADYDRIKANALEVAPRLQQGYYLSKAMDMFLND